MGNETARILIGAVVKKALRDLPDAPERTLRNLVDLALDLADGPFQQVFFGTLQTMLQDSQSPYYGLIRDVVDHVDHEKLLGFGMILGYDSCTAGAAAIRELEEREGYLIPWSLSLALGAGTDLDRVQQIVDQGEELGIRAWCLAAEGGPSRGLELAAAHPQSAFVLMVRPEDLDLTLIDCASELDRLMVAVRVEEGAGEACGRLREAGMLYCVYYVYGDRDRELILSGDLFEGAQLLHPVFTVLVAEKGCSQETREAVGGYVAAARREQRFQTIAWDFFGDGRSVNGIISRGDLAAGFDGQGRFWSAGTSPKEGWSLYDLDLPEILRRAFPKGETEK